MHVLIRLAYRNIYVYVVDWKNALILIIPTFCYLSISSVHFLVWYSLCFPLLFLQIVVFFSFWTKEITSPSFVPPPLPLLVKEGWVTYCCWILNLSQPLSSLHDLNFCNNHETSNLINKTQQQCTQFWM